MGRERNTTEKNEVTNTSEGMCGRRTVRLKQTNAQPADDLEHIKYTFGYIITHLYDASRVGGLPAVHLLFPMWYKHTNFELGTRVPFIVSRPDESGGRKSEALVELVDLYFNTPAAPVDMRLLTRRFIAFAKS